MASIVLIFNLMMFSVVPIAWTLGSLIYFAYKKMFTFKHLCISIGPSFLYALGLMIYTAIVIFGVSL